MMAMVQPKPGKPYVKRDSVAKGDVSAVVGVTGASTGVISLSFEKSCAVAVVKNMLGDDVGDIMNDVKDAVGEITNMVSGQARSGLAEMGLVFQAGTPTVIMGDNHSISHLSKGPIMAIPFETEHGGFTLEFSFDS
ncbi:MAG TPA: chemotaxis protein CheX [Desulfovibrio sp.]|nr:chemotaxis protein CheX [Desulfovibrio sp.]HBR06646.1 chemotaxis protein CheX [Desulfovibrio sp.]